MKTKVLLLFALLPTLALANPRGYYSNVTFNSEGVFTLKVFLDGYPLNRRPARTVSKFDIEPGQHFIRVVAYGPRRTREIRRRIFVDRRSNVNFSIGFSRSRRDIYLNKTSSNPIYRNDNHRRGRRGRFIDNQCYDASYFNVNYVIQQMDCLPYDHGRLQVARNAIRSSTLKSVDLAYLLDHFNYDQSRIDLAAFAYSRICDVNNFHTVFTSFNNPRSVRQLKRRIGYY